MGKRKLYGMDELSPAELAWLTGDESKVKAHRWHEYFLWCLQRGFASWHKGRPICAPELLDRYGHLAGPERVKYLKMQVQAMKMRDRTGSRRRLQSADVVPLCRGPS